MPSPAPFRPSRRTGGFDWPDVCRTLGAAAGGAIDRLGDALQAGLARGQRVVGIGSLRQGEGATTLLLSVAGQLARRGVKVAIVEADPGDPTVSRRLGVVPDAGWRDVAAQGFPMATAVIESLEDGVALLPFCASRSGRRQWPADPSGGAIALGTVRAHYDLVLVDLGPMDETPQAAGPIPHVAPSALDAVLLVHNVRLTTRGELARLCDRLAAAGIPQAGIVENFVPADGRQRPPAPAHP